MFRAAVLCVLILSNPVESLAQSLIAPAVPRTKMEALEARPGAVIVRSFAEIGRITYYKGDALIVEARELANLLTGEKQAGIAVILGEPDQPAAGKVALIDEDEVPALLKAIDAMGGLNHSTTTFEDFHATYRTKGDFTISILGSPEGAVVSLSSGEVWRTTSPFTVGDLTSIRDLIIGAKAKLDLIKEEGEK
jgi:hypothetical protein